MDGFASGEEGEGWQFDPARAHFLECPREKFQIVLIRESFLP
jgi:hypothetical protein